MFILPSDSFRDLSISCKNIAFCSIIKTILASKLLSKLIIIIRLCLIIIVVTLTQLVGLLPFHNGGLERIESATNCYDPKWFFSISGGRRLVVPCSLVKRWSHSFLNDGEVMRSPGSAHPCI